MESEDLKVMFYTVFFVAVIFGIVWFLKTYIGATQENSEENSEVALSEMESNDIQTVECFVDPETGINYLIYDGYRSGGITVRYNTDGTVMVTNVDGDE